MATVSTFEINHLVCHRREVTMDVGDKSFKNAPVFETDSSRTEAVDPYDVTLITRITQDFRDKPLIGDTKDTNGTLVIPAEAKSLIRVHVPRKGETDFFVGEDLVDFYNVLKRNPNIKPASEAQKLLVAVYSLQKSNLHQVIFDPENLLEGVGLKARLATKIVATAATGTPRAVLKAIHAKLNPA
ncbi:MAG: hypothetical protein KGI37_11230 [Alphaproteobacteria bacterium]|nr:hypothetical protein [Alphaproteobacteria bacterium]